MTTWILIQLMYIFTTAKLDAAGQCRVASLANYDFRLQYKIGKSNVEADAPSHIQWDCVTLDEAAVKAIIDMGCTGRLAGTETCHSVTPPDVSPLEQSIIGNQKSGVSATKDHYRWVGYNAASRSSDWKNLWALAILEIEHL